MFLTQLDDMAECVTGRVTVLVCLPVMICTWVRGCLSRPERTGHT